VKIVGRGEAVVFDGRQQRTYDKILNHPRDGPRRDETSLTLSMSGGRHAYWAQLPDRHLFVIDGVERLDRDLVPWTPPVFSRNGRTVVYLMMDWDAAVGAEVCCVLKDGRVIGRHSGVRQTRELLVSDTGRHVYYAIDAGNFEAVIADGSPRSAALAYVRGLAATSDGGRYAYVGRTPGGGNRVVVDDRPHQEYAECGPPVFSPDGTHVAYAAVKDQKKGHMCVVLDGREIREHTISGDVLHVPLLGNGGHLMYFYTSPDGVRVLVDGREFGPYQEAKAAALSRDGCRFMFAGRSNDRWRMIDARGEGPAYDDLSRPAFSDDGSSVSYSATSNGRWTKVIDGRVGPWFDRVGRAAYSPDGQFIAYLAKQGNEWFMVINGSKGRPFRWMYLDPPVFDSPTRLRYMAASEQGLVLVEEDLSAE
jgi:hypothetical protein